MAFSRFSRSSTAVLLAQAPVKRSLLRALLLEDVSAAAALRSGLFRAFSAEADRRAGSPKSVPVNVAHELLQAGHRYLDVRTQEEFGAGHAVGATNIPYMFKSGTGMTMNHTFLNEVVAAFGKDDKILVGCQSGRRSLMATADLLSSGFTDVIDIAGGYLAWRQNGLPTK